MHSNYSERSNMIQVKFMLRLLKAMHIISSETEKKKKKRREKNLLHMPGKLQHIGILQFYNVLIPSKKEYNPSKADIHLHEMLEGIHHIK